MQKAGRTEALGLFTNLQYVKRYTEGGGTKTEVQDEVYMKRYTGRGGDRTNYLYLLIYLCEALVRRGGERGQIAFLHENASCEANRYVHTHSPSGVRRL